jgi:hypothetical protein
MQILTLWIILRLFTSIIAGFVSTIRPLTTIEKNIPLLPPSLPIDKWLDRAFLSPWLRWDAEWYQTIATRGYNSSDGTTAFHPLFPFLASFLIKIRISPLFSLLIVSSVAGIGAYFIFHQLLKMDLDRKDAFFGLLLLALAPPSFILFAPYTEGLFFLCAIGSIFLARYKSWWLASAAGGLAVLTRQQGIFLIFPLVWELWEAAERKPNNILKKWKDWLSLSLIPGGMLILLLYRTLYLKDIQLNISNFQKFIYSFVISPGATQVVPNQRFIWPWQALYIALKKLLISPDVDIWVNIIFGFLFLIILAITWSKLRISYRIYCLVITLVSFSYYTGPIHPYISLPRHLLLAFPIFIGLPQVIKQSWMRLLLIGLSAIGMSFLTILYVLSAWVP